MTYLVGFMEDETKKAVDGYDLVPTNYSILKNVLEKKYGAIDLVTNKLLKDLNNLECPGNDIKKLKGFCMDIDRIQWQLANHEVNVADVQFIYVAESKLKNSHAIIRKLIERKQMKAGP